MTCLFMVCALKDFKVLRFCSFKMSVRGFQMALVCQKVVSQLRNTLPNGVLAAKFSLNFARLSSKDHNFFVSTPNCAPFEALDS